MNECGIKIKIIKEIALIKETLRRIGVVNLEKKCVYPSVYLHQKGDDFYICHFKEMISLHGGFCNLDLLDKTRRNSICMLLEQWKFIKIENKEQIDTECIFVKVIPYNEIKDWTIVHKFEHRH